MFAKVFQQILDSSIAEDYQVRLVFEDFLKLCDKDGVVDMTRESIARRTNVPLEIVSKGITALEQPDRTSRSPEEDGRRIVRLDSHRDWGWRIVNHAKYRESATVEMIRMGEAQRKAEWRKRKGFPHSPSQNKSTDKEADTEAEKSRTVDKSSGTCPGQMTTYPSIDDVLMECNMIGYPKAQGEAFWNHFESSGWIDKNGHAIVKWKPKLATWVSDARSRPTEQAHHKNGASNGAAESILRQKELERVEERIRIIRGGISDHQHANPEEASELRKLKGRKEILVKMLGMTV